MTSFPADKASGELSGLVAQVAESHEPVQITTEQGAAVLVAEEDWRAIQETLHLAAVPGMVQSIREGLDFPIDACAKELDW